MNRSDLHSKLDQIIPSGTKIRSFTRMMGHAMIDLGLLTSIECAYEDCILDTREFPIITNKTKPQDRARPIIDHVVELWQGGSDRPENFQLIHFACNSRKTARLRMADPAHRRLVGEASRRRWANPEIRKEILANVAAGVTPEVRARKSAAMKAHWADPDRRAAHVAQLARGDAWRSARQVDDKSC